MVLVLVVRSREGLLLGYVMVTGWTGVPGLNAPRRNLIRPRLKRREI